MADLIQQLRRARERQGRSQARLSKMIGASASAVADWETGRNRPRLDMLLAWAGALGLRLELVKEKS